MSRRSWLGLAAVALVAIALQLLWDETSVRRTPLPEARWIWAAGVSRPDGDEREHPPEPVAFLVVREVELDGEELAAERAFLDVVADEGYRVWVNGSGPGSGMYREGAPVDRWEISELLLPGTNRIAVEVRSERGGGGLLARLAVGSRSWATDRTWKVLRRWSPGAVGGWSDLSDLERDGLLEEPRVWGDAVTGRWRVGVASIPQELPVPPSVLDPRKLPLRVRHPAGDESEWGALAERADPWGPPDLGEESLWDFGETVEGLLALELARPAGRPSLIYTGNEVPDPATDFPRVFTPLEGAGRWEAIVPDRFRYLLVVGVELAALPEVFPSPATGPAQRSTSGPAEGIYGLRPPRERTRAEELVWRRVRGEGAGRSLGDESDEAPAPDG